MSTCDIVTSERTISQLSISYVWHTISYATYDVVGLHTTSYVAHRMRHRTFWLAHRMFSASYRMQYRIRYRIRCFYSFDQGDPKFHIAFDFRFAFTHSCQCFYNNAIQQLTLTIPPRPPLPIPPRPLPWASRAHAFFLRLVGPQTGAACWKLQRSCAPPPLPRAAVAATAALHGRRQWCAVQPPQVMRCSVAAAKRWSMQWRWWLWLPAATAWGRCTAEVWSVPMLMVRWNVDAVMKIWYSSYPEFKRPSVVCHQTD